MPLNISPGNKCNRSCLVYSLWQKRLDFWTSLIPFSKSCLMVEDSLLFPGLLVNFCREEAWIYKKGADNLSSFPLSEMHNYCLACLKQMDNWKSPAGFQRQLFFWCIFLTSAVVGMMICQLLGMCFIQCSTFFFGFLLLHTLSSVLSWSANTDKNLWNTMLHAQTVC